MHAVRGAGRQVGGPGAGSGANGMHGERLAQGLGNKAYARAERTLNMAYMVVTLDVSKLSGWLKVVAPCRVERRVHAHAMRGMHREAARPKAWGGRARAKRTQNMYRMLVTPDVSQLEMSALKFFRL